MRLANLTGFEIRQSPANNNCFEPPSPDICRLLMFSADQAEPIYISEEFSLHPERRSLNLNPVSFKHTAIKRSFRLAIQLWSNSVTKPSNLSNDWTVVEEWFLDLRQTKFNTGKGQYLTGLNIHTEFGTIFLPRNGSQDSETTIQKPQNNGSETANKLKKVGDTEDSLISRWLSWGKVGASDKGKNDNLSALSLSYPTLVDLWTLQRSLDEAQAASLELATQINNSIKDSSIPLMEREIILMKRLRKIRRNTDVVKVETTKKKEEVIRKRKSQDSLTKNLNISVQHFEPQAHRPPLKRDISHSTCLVNEIRVEQGRLASQLLEIFPIEPVEDRKFHFTINGLILPSVFAINHYDSTQIGAALGFVAQILVLLSQYLDIVLPYPIFVYGSQSYIIDNITRIKHGSNKFPLWTRGALLYRVEYALYLLHKDIEQLFTTLNLAVVDLKQTLANLKNVLLVLSSNYKNESTV